LAKTVPALLFLTLPLGVWTVPLGAQTLPGCVTASLSAYESPAVGNCVLGATSNGGLDVFNWAYISGPTGADATILITPNPGPGGIGGGFGFSGFAPQVSGTQSTYVIDYSYLIDPGPVTSGMDLSMDPPFGDVFIQEDLCINAGFGTTTNGNTVCQIRADVQGGFLTFNPQSLSVTVPDPNGFVSLNPQVTQSDIANLRFTFVVGGPDGGGFDSLSSNNTVVDAVPEPLTSALGLGGLLAIEILRRYRRSDG
jgi:hypothetical protein